MSKHLSKRIYISTPKNVEDKIQGYATQMRNKGLLVNVNEGGNAINNCDVVVLVIAEGADLEKTKKDMNSALDHGKPIVCFMVGNPVLDSVMSLELGSKLKVTDDDKGFEKLMRAIPNARKPANKYRQKQIFFGFVAVAVIFVMIMAIPKNTEKKEKKKTEKQTKEKEVVQVVKEETLDIEPALLKGLIDNGIDTNKDGAISEKELSKVVALDLADYGISDISALKYAKNLLILDLSNNKISDVSALSSAQELQSLILTGNSVEDISCLKYLKNLDSIVMN